MTVYTTRKKLKSLATKVKKWQKKYPAYTVEKKTIEGFYLIASTLNLNPVGQRKDVEPSMIGGDKPSKAQGIIGAIWNGMYISELLVAVEESIDCGHRARYILAFIAGQFPTHATSVMGEKWWVKKKGMSDDQVFTQDEKDWFYGFPLTWTDMYELTGQDIGKQFIQTNTITPPTIEEKWNAHGLKQSVVTLREFVEIVDYSKEKNKEYAKKGIVTNMLPFWKNKVAPEMMRSKKLGWLLESAVIHTKGSLTTFSPDEVDDYIETTTPKNVKKIEALITEECEFYHNVGVFWKKYKSAPTIGVANMLRILYWVLKEEYDKFEIKDYEDFTKHFVNKYNTFIKSKATTPYLIKGEPADPKYGFIAKAFGSYINKKTELRKVSAVKKWISGFVDWNLVRPIVNDVFPKEMKLKRWIEVGEVCEIEDKPLKFEDAIGCHIVSVDDDGKVEYDNLLISNHFHNKKMGTMNALKYKELWLKGEIV